MPRIAATLTFALLLAGPAFGQPAADSKVFHFAHTETPQGFQEVVNAIRAIAELQQVSLVTESKAVAVKGPAEKLSMAEWLFRALDLPAEISTGGKFEFATPGATNDLARVFYIVRAGNPQGMQEIVNAIRSIGELQRVMVCNQPRAIALRGTAAQVALAEWLIDALDKPAGAPASATQSRTLTANEFRRPDGSAPVAKVLYPPFMKTPQHLQEGVSMVRTIAEIQRVMAHSAVGAIILRGSAEQAALAEWLLNSLNKPSTASGPALPSEGRQPEMITRVFHLANLNALSRYQELLDRLRTQAHVMRLTIYTPERAIALRAPAEQVAAAERMVREADRPPAQ